MKALILNKLHQPLDFQEIETPKPEKNFPVVAIRAAALNHRDVWILKGQYAGIKLPASLGSDGAGELDGKKVVIYPALEWGKNPKFQSANFRVLGMPDAGMFAEFIKISKKNIFPTPAHLNFEEIAALPVAGLTAWRVLFSRCQLKKGEKVLICGIGGGVALIAMQFALAAGAEVFVTSGSDEKIEKAVRLGAKSGVNYRTDDWDKILKKEIAVRLRSRTSDGSGAKSNDGFDVVVDSAGGDSFSKLVGLCSPGGRIGIYGGGLGKINNLSPQIIFWKQINILGSTMGSPAEFGKMLQFVERHEIVPVLDSVFSLENGNAAFEKLAAGEQFGKIVLKI